MFGSWALVNYLKLGTVFVNGLGKIFLMSTMKMLKGILEFSSLFITSISYFQAME